MTTTITLADTRLADGTRLPYAFVGQGQATPLVFLHGYTDSWRSFEPVIERLDPEVRAFALTQRGHGDADRPAHGYEMADLADDVVGFLDRIGVDRAVVVGHSLGAWVAARVAVAHPERVAGLVLIGGFANLADNPAVAELAGVIESLDDPVDRGFITEFQHSTVAQPVPAAFMDQAIAESAKLPAHVWRAVATGFLEADHLTGLSTISAPTLLIWGDRDAFVPRSDQDVLLESIPGAELVVYPGTGHAVQWEQPGRVVRELARFVAGRVS